MNTYNSWLSLIPKYPLLRNDDRRNALRAQNRKVYDFGIGDPVEPTPAFIQEALKAGVDNVSQYPTSAGSDEFRGACAKWVKERLGAELNLKTEIISSNGSKEAIFHIPHVLLNNTSEKKGIAFPDPGFPVYRSSTILSGGTPFPIKLHPEKNYIFDPLDVPKNILSELSAVWVCYPHNPTGAMISKNQMEKIYEWALSHDITLLSDECYIDMYFPGTEKPKSFLEVAQKEKYKNLLTFFSLSKRSGMTGYRSGFVAGDERLIAHYAKYRPHVGLGTPNFVQKAAVAAWNDDKHVTERNQVFFEKRQLVDAFLKEMKIEFLPSTATFYVWAKVPKGFKNGEEYAQAVADKVGAIITPGDCLGEGCEDRFRLALVPSKKEIIECLEIWKKAFA